MSNSMSNILDKLAAGDGTQGWGAIVAISRSDLERQLQQQYIERYQYLSFMPLFSGEVVGDGPGVDTLKIEGVELGVPTLLFQAESSSEASIGVAMNVVAGRYSGLHQSPGSATTVSAKVKVTEPMGFRLTLTVPLATDEAGRVVLNLAQGYGFTCNLAGLDKPNNWRLAQLFADRFREIPQHRGVFNLVHVELERYQVQPPVNVRVYPMAAPGATLPGAENFGDGALLLFMQLRNSLAQGRFPPADSLPYPIPDEHRVPDHGNYGSALILSRDVIPDIDTERLSVLDSVRFPCGDTFVAQERYWHDDLVVFGTLQAAQVSVLPAFTTIKAGQTQRFTVQNWLGQVIPATRWTAFSLQSHVPAGHGSISADGVYQAPDAVAIGRDWLRVVVSATYEESGITRTVTALLGVAFESMELVPRVTVVAGGAAVQPVSLGVSTLDTTAVKWGLRGTEYGAFSENGSAGLFVADARSGKRALVAQQIGVHGSEEGIATVLIANGQQMLRIEPAFVPRVRKSQVVQLHEDSTLLPGLRRRWKVIGGEGTVDQQGRFTAPDTGVIASSVVSCEVVNNSVVLASGYSVIEPSEVYDEPTWELLSMFNITVPGGSNQQRDGALFPNGYQQIRLLVRVQAMEVDGVDYELSATERGSMLLVENDSRQNLDSFPSCTEGMPVDDKQRWRFRLTPNRFELAGAQAVPAESDLNAPVITTQEFYLHSRESALRVGTFYATFQDDEGRWWTSLELHDVNSRVSITPRSLPSFDDTWYTFTPTRVEGLGGDPSVDPPAENEEDIPFEYHLKTIDYWTLSARQPLTGQAIEFKTLTFLKEAEEVPARTSIILWESEQSLEIMFSYTGSIFDDEAVVGRPLKIAFDVENLKRVAPAAGLDIAVKEDAFEAHTLIISLHRTFPVDYVKPGAKTPLTEAFSRRDILTGTLLVRLLDSQGNAHERRISFLSDGVGRRNRIKHIKYSPPPQKAASK